MMDTIELGDAGDARLARLGYAATAVWWLPPEVALLVLRDPSVAASASEAGLAPSGITEFVTGQPVTPDALLDAAGAVLGGEAVAAAWAAGRALSAEQAVAEALARAQGRDEPTDQTSQQEDAAGSGGHTGTAR